MSQVVSVTLNELRLEPHVRCSRDSLSLYDGFNLNSPTFGRFCTFAMSASRLSSSGPPLFIFFQTDGSVNEGRFLLSWAFVSQGGQGRFIMIINICLLMFNFVVLKQKKTFKNVIKQAHISRIGESGNDITPIIFALLA